MRLFKDLKYEGNLTTLVMAFLYFDISFMVWTIFGSISTELAYTLILNGEYIDSSKMATLLSIPVLSGAILRIVLGFGVDKFGAKNTAIYSQIVVLATLLFAFIYGNSITYNQLLVVGFGLGFAGASFAVALPQAGQWYPKRMQGLVLGVVGAGNIGVVIDFLLAPKIAELWGWSMVFGIGALLSMIVLLGYIFLVKDAPNVKTKKRTISDYLELLKHKDTTLLSLAYAMTFGGFIGFAGYMKIYFIDTYSLELQTFGLSFFNEENIHVVAGYFGAISIFAGAVLRPVGGYLSDTFGGVKTLILLLGSISLLSLISSITVFNFGIAMMIMFYIMASLGMANGAVFGLVAYRFQDNIGLITGIIGAAGGIGGVLLIKTFGWSKDMTNGYSLGFLIFSILVLSVLIGIYRFRNRW